MFQVKIKHLSQVVLRTICRILIKLNDEEDKKLKKYKVVNRNVKMNNEIVQLKIKEKRKKRNEKLNKIKKMIKVFEAIKMKVNIKDEDVQDNKVERFNCGFEECKQSQT